MPLAYSHTHTYTETRKGDYFHDGCYKNDRHVGFRQFWSVKFVSSYQVGGYYQNYCLSIAAIDFATTNPPIYCTLLFFFILDTHTKKSVGKILAILAVFELLMGPKGSRNAGHRNKTNNECNQVCNKLKDTNAFVGQNCWDIFFISIFLWLISWFSLI